MHNYGIVLRKLREINHLPLKKAAKHIGRSGGWLSEIENNKGFARLSPQEFERIVTAYNGEQYRKQFPIWIAQAHKPVTPPREIEFSGPILKYLRKKAKLTLTEAASKAGLSKSYISYLENGSRQISIELRNQLMQIYGYSPGSFKNFSSEDKRAKNIPLQYKLNLVLKRLEDPHIEKVLSFALESLGARQAPMKPVA